MKCLEYYVVDREPGAHQGVGHIKIFSSKTYALTFTASPAFAILVAIIKPPETAIVTPQKASRFLHPERRIAPAIGLPISKPNEMGKKSMPLRVP